jgi:hypothetical protein
VRGRKREAVLASRRANKEGRGYKSAGGRSESPSPGWENNGHFLAATDSLRRMILAHASVVVSEGHDCEPAVCFSYTHRKPPVLACTPQDQAGLSLAR